MPSFIKNKNDEKLWNKAKKIVENEYNYSENEDNFWALTNSIYQKMNKHKNGSNKKDYLICKIAYKLAREI